MSARALRHHVCTYLTTYTIRYWHITVLPCQAVIEHLRKSGQVSSIALWGRSMGAATALLHGDRDPSIAALVLDSAFADLPQLAEEMVERGRQAVRQAPLVLA